MTGMIVHFVAPKRSTADLRRLRYAVLRRSAKRSQRESAVNPCLVIAPDRVGGSLAAPVLPHHRTYGSVYGGSQSNLEL
jgi:hypothetical protein